MWSLPSVLQRHEWYAVELYISAGIVELGLRKLLVLFQEHRKSSLFVNGIISIWRAGCEGAWRLFSAICFPTNAVAQYFFPFKQDTHYHGVHHHGHQYRNGNRFLTYFGSFPSSTIIAIAHTVFLPVHYEVIRRRIEPLLELLGITHFNKDFINGFLNGILARIINAAKLVFLDQSGGKASSFRVSFLENALGKKGGSGGESAIGGGGIADTIMIDVNQVAQASENVASHTSSLAIDFAISVVEMLCVLHMKLMVVRLLVDLYHSDPRSNLTLEDFSRGGTDDDVFFREDSEEDMENALYTGGLYNNINPAFLLQDYKVQEFFNIACIIGGSFLMLHSLFALKGMVLSNMQSLH
eukprot:m.138630 g.138630  ORF g.138630 m.138630 type:complete len:354 (+) comp15773_c0_seq1:66-1127(+)